MDRAALIAMLSYDPATGVFRWRSKSGSKVKVGAVAGTIMAHGYVRICIRRRFFYGHRLAWLFVHGDWPTEEIDHINGDRADNRIANLRAADRARNARNAGLGRNNTSGVTGVSWAARDQKWSAYIMVSRRKISLGNHATIESAVAARKAAERRYFGEFARAA
jgi:hypothetical protein